MTAMYFADTNRAVLRLLAETQWGQTPTSGNVRTYRMTSHAISTKKNTVKSNEIRDDRMVSDIIETEMMSDGSINGEFSAGSYDDLFQAFVMGTWTRPMTHDFWVGVNVSWVSTSKIAIAGGVDYTGYLTVGRRMKTEGFVNPANNNFWTIASTDYNSGAGQTEIVMSQTTAVVEAGNIRSKVSDANDVIVLLNTSIRSGTSGASTFDSNGTNAFASAIAAGQLNVGQRIHVAGLGYGTGTVTFAATAVAGSGVTVNDGVNAYTFVAGTDFAVGSSATNSATALAAAINSARALGVSTPQVFPNVKASSAAGVVTVVNLNGAGGSLAKVSDGTSNITIVTFAGGDNTQSGVFTLTGVTSDVLTVTPQPTTNANSGSLAVTVRGSMLRNPGLSANIVPQSFSVETGYEDVNLWFKQDGIQISSFSLDVNASAVVTTTFELMGRATVAQSGTILGNSPYVLLQPTQTEILNATTDVGTIYKDGVALSTAVKQIKMDGKASLANQMAVGSKFPVGIRSGRFELSGSVTAYFEDLDLFNNFLNHDTVSLSFNFSDSAGNAYYWTVPAAKFTADPITAKGVDQDVLDEVTFEAFRDPATSCMFQIDRFSSLLPV